MINEYVTEQLLLRPYTDTYGPEFIALNNNALSRQYMDGALSVESATTLFKQVLKDNASPQNFACAVLLKQTKKYIGHAFIETTTSGSEVGFLFFPEYWGKGLGTELAKALVKIGFEVLGLTQIFATVDPTHAASQRVLTRAGFLFISIDEDAEGAYYTYQTTNPLK